VERLTRRDLEGALDFLREAEAVTGPSPFPTPILERLRELVPADAVTWHEWSVNGDRIYRVSLSANDAWRTLSVAREYPRFRHQDPFAGGAPGAGPPSAGIVGRVVKFSDVLTLRELRRLDLHAYVCRPLGIDYVMKMFLPLGNGIASSFVFDRSRRDFSERDRSVLELLLPHLAHLAEIARARHPALMVSAALTPRERDILLELSEGKTNDQIADALSISAATVRTHLQHAYAKLGVRSRTAAVATLRRLDQRPTGFGAGKGLVGNPGRASPML
jgi:DNA-binding CsgD family transcriptional regulator